MKILQPAIIFTVLGVFLFLGCTKVVPTSTSDNKMTAVVDTVNFVGTGGSVAAVKNGTTLNILSTMTSVSIYPTTCKIALTLNLYSQTQTSVPIDGYYCSALIDRGSGAVAASRGLVTITVVAPYLQGTYSFKCSDSTVVTHGTFYCVAPN